MTQIARQLTELIGNTPMVELPRYSAEAGLGRPIVAKVEAMMGTIVKAFDKQLDSLFGAEAMDISTDITVMENLLAQEGLSGPERPKTSGGGTTLEL